MFLPYPRPSNRTAKFILTLLVEELDVAADARSGRGDRRIRTQGDFLTFDEAVLWSLGTLPSYVLCGVEDAEAQQTETGTAIHGSLDEFEVMNRIHSSNHLLPSRFVLC